MDLSNIFSYLLRALGNTSVWLQSFKPEFGLVVVYTRFMVILDSYNMIHVVYTRFI